MKVQIALSGVAALGLLAVSAPPAAASDWGCQVLLCLATPGPPTTYAACVPPITKLWSALARGDDFPTCSEGGVSKANVSWADKDHTIPRSVTMTNNDGSQQSYSLSTYSTPPSDSPAPGSGAVAGGGGAVPQ